MKEEVNMKKVVFVPKNDNYPKKTKHCLGDLLRTLDFKKSVDGFYTETVGINSSFQVQPLTFLCVVC